MDQASRLRELVGNQQAPPAGQPQQAVVRQAQPRSSRILVITSGKGGVGKTNLTVNLALALAQRGRRVILFDADMGMANVDVILNISPPFTITDVIAGRKSLGEVLFAIDPYLSIVPGGSPP